MTCDIDLKKASLRKTVLEKRRSIPKDQKDLWDERICELLFSSFDFSNTCVLCYNSLTQEVDTRRISKTLLEKGVKLYYPKTSDDSRMDFFEYNESTRLTCGFMGVREPDGETEIFSGGSAICIVPGLCFSKSGGRLGYGAGFYDRFLEGKDLTKIALSYECFIIDDVPCSQFDARMDYIITQNGVIDCADSREA